MSARGSDGVPPIGRNDVHLATHLFDGHRLAVARELRALTKVELAARVGKTPSALSQFESGRLRPDASTVASLALTLGVFPSFFARPLEASIGVEECHFRSLRSATQRERRQLIARGILMCELLAAIEELVELPEEGVTSVARTAASPEDVEALAQDVRRAWDLGLGPLPNVVRLLESRGILVAEIPTECSKVDAFSSWHRGRPMIFLVSPDVASPSRRRYDAGHELGHLVMHADAIPGSQDLERQANRFAAAFLVPAGPFLRECPRTLNWTHLYELKRRWGLSAAALVRRAFDLGVFSEATYKRAFVQLNQSGERWQEPHEPVMERPSLLQQGMGLVAGDFSVNDLAERTGLPAAEVQELLGH